MSKLKAIQQGDVQAVDADAETPVKRVGKLKALQANRPAPANKDTNRAVAKDLGNLQHYQTALDLDIRKVANQKDLAEKNKVKQSLLPTYLPFVDDYVASGDNYPNNVAVHVMIWLIDIAEMEHGIDLALYLIKQKQVNIERIKRDIPTWLMDEMYDWANNMLKQDQGASPYLDEVIKAAENDKWDVHILCYSKLYSMLAKHHVRNNDYESALEVCLKAKKINPEKHGVKLLTEEIEKYIQKSGAESA